MNTVHVVTLPVDVILSAEKVLEHDLDTRTMIVKAHHGDARSPRIIK